MKPIVWMSTGIESLDDILNGLRIGDNVVWQVDQVSDYRHYVTPYVDEAKKAGRRVVYLRFATHEPLVDSEDGVTTYKLNAHSGFEHFTGQVYDIVTKEGPGTFYVFDCLSHLLSAWATDLMIGNFFVIICPYLFELETIAYFSIVRHSHSFKTIARIRETTQVLIEVYHHKGRYYVHPLKVWNRYAPTMFLPHAEKEGRFLPIINSIDATQLFSDISRREAQSPRRHLDYWDRLFLKAEDCLKRSRNPFEIQRMVDQLCRVMIGREEKILGLARQILTLDDLLHIKSRLIGTGFVGGKTVGMLLARKILENDRSTPWGMRLEQHDSFYIGSDVFYAFLVHNGLWKLRMEQRTEEGYFEAAVPLRQKMLKGAFPDEIKEQFQQMMEYYGQSPIIVRSSSLLEDAFGNAFAGKYESVFAVNQGSPEQRYLDFAGCVRKVFASTMNEDALTYRRQRGLDRQDEQMALLVQRVSGSYRRHYFFPDFAGVGVSYNTFVWKHDMDPRSGMLRVVAGLGTRAVNRVEHDYPRIVALDNPSFRPHAGQEDARRFSQRYMDVLNVATNAMESVSLVDEINAGTDLRTELFAEMDYETTARMRELGIKGGDAWVVTFDALFARTDFGDVMQAALKKIEASYNYPVEIEFTANFKPSGDFRVNLLQCRPLQTKGEVKRVTVPRGLASHRILFSSQGSFMGGSMSQAISRVIYVDPKSYTELPITEKYDVARLIGKLNRLIRSRDGKRTMLLGPGRWGTTTPSLGVPVGFSEINNMAVMGEIAYGGGDLMPELSFGTHFFQDLVETDIFYVALFPENPGVVFNPGLLESLPNRTAELAPEAAKYLSVVRVYDTHEGSLRIAADIISQELVCFLDKGGH
jgi:hypothetical protein